MTAGRLDQLVLLGRTTRNLRASQISHRVRLRAQRSPASRPLASAIIALVPLPRGDHVAAWPPAFVPLDAVAAEGCPSPEENARGRFMLLHDARDLGWPVQWSAPGASRLWRYHLHYMEWAWSFAAHPDRDWARHAFAELWTSWERSSPFGRGDPWSPYVASLRAWALCGTYSALVAGSGLEQAVQDSLVRHARFLRWHLERDVGGNHLVKNLKALIGLGVFQGDERLVDMASAELRRQLPIQVLPDGGHYERSPSYHCQVLADLIDVDRLLTVAGRSAVPGLAAAIEAMRRWLGAMLMPDGDVPLFNDCTRVGPFRVALLQPAPRADDRLTVLPSSGYVVARPDERIHLVADVGDPCPPDLPAHAHADSLSFELAVDGVRLVVDGGTSTYEPGAQRAHERSTAAHNTVTVDGTDSTEVWGTFRAARLAGTTFEGAHDDRPAVTVVAFHDGYRRLPGAPVHHRTWRVDATRLEIVDEIAGQGHHRIESRLHVAADRVAKVTWSGPAGLRVTEGPATYATGFNRRLDGHVVCASWEGSLPVTLRAELHLDGPVLQGSSGNDEEQTRKDTR